MAQNNFKLAPRPSNNSLKLSGGEAAHLGTNTSVSKICAPFIKK
jgi:hypothetical protein